MSWDNERTPIKASMAADLKVDTDRIDAMQRLMFGETTAEMREAAAMFRNLEDPVDLIGYAQCILSDAQEAMRRGQTEAARQWTNKAKYFMSEASVLIRQKERK